MRISFSYADVPPLEVPDANFLDCLEPRHIEPPAPVERLAEEVLDRPLEAARLEDQVSPSSRVLLLVDDITRQTPAARLLPSILNRLENRGVVKENINFLIAAGTHARMTKEDLEKKLGAPVLAEYAVHIHHWREENVLREIGSTADGTPVHVNRMLGEADFIIGVGQIVPHRVMGFTGGATIVQPGVSGPRVTGYTHWRSALYPGDKILGIAENSVRLEVEQIARQAGLRFIVNVVMDAEARVLEVVAGDPVAAHRKGAERSRQVYGVVQPRLAEIVVAESFPADYDLWQAAKGIYSSELAVAPGGVVIVVTPCPHGVSDEHPEVEKLGYHGFEAMKEMVEAKTITDLVAAAHLVHVGRVVRDRAHGIMVSPGIPAEVQRRLGFEPARTPQEALGRAFELVGRKAQVTVLRHGGDVLPLISESEVSRSASS
jgi:nickel-dependent lactate racemase